MTPNHPRRSSGGGSLRVLVLALVYGSTGCSSADSNEAAAEAGGAAGAGGTLAAASGGGTTAGGLGGVSSRSSGGRSSSSGGHVSTGGVSPVGGTTAVSGSASGGGGLVGGSGGAEPSTNTTSGGSTPGGGGSSGTMTTGGVGGSSSGLQPIDASGGVSGAAGAAGTAWDAPNTGNPFLPGYFADPSILYDADDELFYLYSTTDGNWIDFSAEPMAWVSKDFVHWTAKPLSLPELWPKRPLWAPSAIKHPTNGKYYLMYSVNSQTFVAYADSPLGPWSNATAGATVDKAPLFAAGSMWGRGDGFDAQFFVDDDDKVYMTFGGSGGCGVAKLAFGADFKVTIDGSDPRMTDGTAQKFKRLSGLTNYLEGSVMFKSGGRYFVAYSVDACQNYQVQYAVGSSPVGPFTHASNTIVRRDDPKHILGPGHNSVLQYGGDAYIVYHRQHYQYVDVKRQVAVDRIAIDGDNISANVQSHAGVWSGKGALESVVAAARAAAEPNLAFGKPVLASSESDYKGGQSRETFSAVKGFYSARYAVDQNFGTRWAPTSLPATLLVDLQADLPIGRCETSFEYAARAYRYRIDYLPASAASDLAGAQASSGWLPYADRSANKERLLPAKDSREVVARYLRLTVLSADLPTATDEIRTILQTDYADRVSVVEFKVFSNA